MANNMEINWDVLYKAIDQTWCKRKEEGHDEWHGYGECCFEEDDDCEDCDCPGKQHPKADEKKGRERRMMLLVEPGGNVPELKKSIYRKCALSPGSPGKLFHEDLDMTLETFITNSMALPKRIDVIVAEPFEQPAAGNFYRPSTLLHPGARVFSTSSDLGDSTNGTIGAFLRAKGTRGPAWLLSNKHVLLQQEQRLDSVEVRGAGQTLISREVQFRGLRDTVNSVDAAIARVMNSDEDEIEAIYDGIQIHCPHPMKPRLGMEVYKLGNATGVTKGRIICHLKKVFVQDANKRGAGFEFKDPYLIGSDTTFMASGDSGSLLIGCGHPVALLFAMANKVKWLENMHFVPPFGLACSIVDVLDQLPKQGNSEWEIMLDDIHIKDCCCHPAKDCGCHKETCSCYKRHCLCHAEYCPYYCPCGASQEKHKHCTCKSGHALYGKECYCEEYHANYGKKQPAGDDCQENGGANGPDGDGGENGGPNGPRADHGNKNREHAQDAGPRHGDENRPHKR